MLETEAGYQRRHEQQTRIGHQIGLIEVTAIRSIPRDTGFTESASWCWDKSDVEHRYFPKQGGTFRGYAVSIRLRHRCIEAKAHHVTLLINPDDRHTIQ